MTESYKLTYFNIKAVAEPIRFILAYAGVKYDDIRVPNEEWPEIKKNYPYGQLPVLEVNGKLLAQSNTICRYLGKKFNLNGANDWEAAKIDEIADTIVDVKRDIRPAYLETDPAKKAEQMKNVVENVVSKFYGKMDTMISSSGGPYLTGKNITWADLMVAHYLEGLGVMLSDFPDILDSYPNLKKLQQTVFALPPIKAWIENRPKTQL